MVKDTYKFDNGYKVTMSLTDNPHLFRYQFYDEDNDLVNDLVFGLPTQANNYSNFIRAVKECNDNLSKKELQSIKKKITKIISALQGEKEKQYIDEQQRQALEIRRKSHVAKKFMEGLKQPLIYIGSVVDWLTAGERINTLICFCAGCSQIILQEPISIIGYGEASSGKTFIQQTAASLLPEEFLIHEKHVSPAALFNRASLDTKFYDGKIVCYGDMGGQNDRDNMQEAIDLMKELQTDGFLRKPVSVKQGDGRWGVDELTLEGRPAIWYTTVPSFIDGQEESRAILYSPRTDNRHIFNKRNRLLTLNHGSTYSKFHEIQQKTQIIQHMVLHLREVMTDYIVIDPYYDVISDLLKDSKFYKRDAFKYMALLDAISAINFYHNKKITLDNGQKALVTSKNDVQLFLSLIEPYWFSISQNVKPKSREVYEIIRDNINDWKALKGADYDGYNDGGFRVGITIKDFFEESDTDIPYNSLRSYFTDLRDAGLLTVVGNEGRANQYDIVPFSYNEDFYELDYSDIISNVEEELGKELADIVRNDPVNITLSIKNQHKLIEATKW